MKRPAVFLDRDGTLNEEVGYIHNAADLMLIPGAGEAVRRLNAAGFLAILVTNQSGPARGYYPESHIQTLHDRLVDLLLDEGALLDGLYYCPHLPEGTVPRYTKECRCRKPGPQMIEDAARDLEVDVAHSYMVGDKATDVEFGQNAGCRTVLLTSGYGERVLAGEYQWKVEPDHVAPTLLSAVEWILEDAKRRAP